jgi:hypothetical protein
MRMGVCEKTGTTNSSSDTRASDGRSIVGMDSWNRKCD